MSRPFRKKSARILLSTEKVTLLYIRFVDDVIMFMGSFLCGGLFMGKVKISAVVLAAVVLVTMFSSCFTSTIRGSKTVKEDDPWYESTKFEMVGDIGIGEEAGDCNLCESKDKIFSLYCVTWDKWCNTRTVLDAYDYEGNLLSRLEVTLPEDIQVGSVYNSTVDPEGKTVSAIVNLWYPTYTDPAFIEIDAESGKVTKIKEMYFTDNPCSFI